MVSLGLRIKRNFLCTTVIASAMSGVVAAPYAMAQSPVAAVAESVTLNIPAQPLKNALRSFAEATHLQLVYNSELVAGRASPKLSGSYTPAAALQQLLAGSGLEYRFTSPRVVTLAKVTSSDGSKVIGTVEVEGAQGGGKNSGVNGSSDPTATEGSGSYTTDAMSVGSKTAQSIRETPQSVSVMTQQQLQDQALTNLVDALKQAPGIATSTNTYGNTTFYSRGYEITNFMVDGVAMTPNPFPNLVQAGQAIPLAIYDHVEVLRGPDGMFAGNGDPGGAVNLTRKKPLDHNQVIIEGAAGSWNNNRGMLDVSGPVPGTDGRVRTRFVIEDKAQDYFYRLANSKSLVGMGHVEVDVTSSTLLNFGASYTKQEGLPFTYGLGRKPNGDDLGMPRDTCLCLPWSHAESETKEVFAGLQQKFGDDWKVKFNVTHKTAENGAIYGFVSSSKGYAPGTTSSATMSYSQYYMPTDQLAADVTLNGKFRLFGREHSVVVGADMQHMSEKGYNSYASATTNSLTYDQVINFNPYNYPQPSFYRNSYYDRAVQDQTGMYATIKLALLDSLHLTGGARETAYSYGLTTLSYLNTGVQSSTLKTDYSAKGQLTPYGGLVYDVSKEWSVYTSYTDIYKVQNNIDTSNNLLPPITGANYEAGIKGELLDNRLKVSLAAYSTRQYGLAIKNSVISFTAPTTYTASGKNQSEGIDAEIGGELLPGWQLTGSYVNNKNKTDVGIASAVGLPLVSLAPRHLVKIFTTYQLPGRFSQWTVGGGFNWQSSTYNSGSICTGTLNAASACKNDAGATIALTPYSFTTDPYAVFSAVVKYKYDDHWLLSLNVNNVFDKVYYSTVGGVSSGNWYGAPRNALLTLRGTW
jgi:TonB-dependent siderophore receptor